jgi:hypothetical protein
MTYLNKILKYLNSLKLPFLTMWKFLRRIFLEEVKKEDKKEKLGINEIEKWFKDKTKGIYNGLNIEVGEIRERLNREILSTKEDLAVLNTAKLHNPKISVREKQFMEGNRKAYILSVNNFLRNIDVGETDYDALLNFCHLFGTRLEKFGKSTVKSYQILQEFFAHESRNIAIRVKNIDGLVRKMHDRIMAANLSKIRLIEEMINELKEKILMQGKLMQAFQEESNKRNALSNQKEKKEQELLDLKKSKEYKELNALKEEKDRAEANIREHNAKIIQAFSVMERPLRKLGRMVLEESELLEHYIDNPVKALIADNELKVVGLLKKLEGNINNLTLELKDKKRQKVLNTVKGLTEEYLADFVTRYNELEEKLAEIKGRINDNHAQNKENELKYELGSLNEKLEAAAKEVESVNTEVSKININRMRQNLVKEINELLKTEITIT